MFLLPFKQKSPNGRFPSGFLAKILYDPDASRKCANFQRPHLRWFD
jgi:hypothetical protein